MNTPYDFANAHLVDPRVAAATKRFFKKQISPAEITKPKDCNATVGLKNIH